MTQYKGDNLTGRVEIDGNRYEKCKFKDVELVYRGGDPPSFVHCQFERMRMTFDGPAANTVALMKALYGGGFEHIVEATLQEIRGKKT